MNLLLLEEADFIAADRVILRDRRLTHMQEVHRAAVGDNLRVGRHDGVAAVVERLKGNPLFAHVTLTRSERSQIAALVTEMLEGF